MPVCFSYRMKESDARSHPRFRPRSGVAACRQRCRDEQMDIQLLKCCFKVKSSFLGVVRYIRDYTFNSIESLPLYFSVLGHDSPWYEDPSMSLNIELDYNASLSPIVRSHSSLWTSVQASPCASQCGSGISWHIDEITIL